MVTNTNTNQTQNTHPLLICGSWSALFVKLLDQHLFKANLNQCTVENGEYKIHKLRYKIHKHRYKTQFKTQIQKENTNANANIPNSNKYTLTH